MANKDRPKLQPCPCCGGTAKYDFYANTVRIECETCFVTTKRFTANVNSCAVEDAAAAWNRRVNNGDKV